MNQADNEKSSQKYIINIVSYLVLKGPHKRSQYSSVWKQKKIEDEGGNNNKAHIS